MTFIPARISDTAVTEAVSVRRMRSPRLHGIKPEFTNESRSLSVQPRSLPMAAMIVFPVKARVYAISESLCHGLTLSKSSFMQFEESSLGLMNVSSF